MGFSPRDIDLWTWWEYRVCVSGWNKAHGGEQAMTPPTPDEHDALVAKHG